MKALNSLGAITVAVTIISLFSSCSNLNTQSKNNAEHKIEQHTLQTQSPQNSEKNKSETEQPTVSPQLPEVSKESENQTEQSAAPTQTPQGDKKQSTSSPQTPQAQKSDEKNIASSYSGNLDFDFLNSKDNKGSGWGFKKNKGAEPDIYNSTKELFARYNTYYMDQTKPKALYLTFDEGYENGYTASILDTLKQYNVKAAFFITGPYAKGETELVQRMIDEGHIIGNHTVNHPNLPKLVSSEKMVNELTSLNNTVKDKYGVEMKYMRPPEGEWSERLIASADALGFKTILWSFAYRDWDPSKQKGADYAYDQVTPYLHDGAILLLHAVSKDNTEALGRIIEYAHNQGYEFRSLDELSQN